MTILRYLKKMEMLYISGLRKKLLHGAKDLKLDHFANFFLVFFSNYSL